MWGEVSWMGVHDVILHWIIIIFVIIDVFRIYSFCVCDSDFFGYSHLTLSCSFSCLC